MRPASYRYMHPAWCPLRRLQSGAGGARKPCRGGRPAQLSFALRSSPGARGPVLDVVGPEWFGFGSVCWFESGCDVAVCVCASFGPFQGFDEEVEFVFGECDVVCVSGVRPALGVDADLCPSGVPGEDELSVGFSEFTAAVAGLLGFGVVDFFVWHIAFFPPHIGA